MNNSLEYQHKYYKKFWWGVQAIKDRVKRTLARRLMIKKWLVQKYDKTKEVDHIRWVKYWNWKSNLRILSMKKNRQLWQKKATIARRKNWNINS